MDTPKRRGQPPKPPEERRDHRLLVRLNQAEADKLKQLGGAKWVRQQLKERS